MYCSMKLVTDEGEEVEVIVQTAKPSARGYEVFVNRGVMSTGEDRLDFRNVYNALQRAANEIMSAVTAA